MLKKLIYAKIFIQRSMTYYQIVNAGLICLIFLKSFNIPSLYYIPAIILTIFLMVLWGYIENKTKIFNTEQKLITNEQPQVMEILRLVRKIENILNSKENNKS